MGNCVETCRERQGDQETWKEPEEEEEVEVAVMKGMAKIEDQMDEDSGNRNIRVKILLTKEELGWLVMKLSENKGGNNSNSKGNRLEEILSEIERGRRNSMMNSTEFMNSGSWKPSLESIMEIPEVPETMDRSSG